MATIEARNTDWIETAPVRIERSAVVAAPPRDVWAALADNATWPDWFPGFRSCAFVTDQPHGVGSIRELRQDKFEVREEIIRWEPGTAWAMTVVDINVGFLIGMAEDVTLVGVGNGSTAVTWKIGAELAWRARPLKFPLRAKNGKMLSAALAQLDQRISTLA